MPPKKVKEPKEEVKPIFAEAEARFSDLAKKNESSKKETLESLTNVHASLSSLKMWTAQHKMATQSTFLEHKSLIGKNKQEIDSAVKELEEAFDTLWPLISRLEKSVQDNSETTSTSSKEIDKKHAELASEVAQHVVDLTKFIERKHKLALAKISKQVKVEVKVDEEESKKVASEIKRLEKLIEKIGKYEYGSQLNVLSGGTIVGFTGQLNFKSGFTVAQNGSQVDVTSNGTGGGLGYLAATGAVNNSNTSFTFPSPPTLVNVNGAMYANGHGVTISDTTGTLDNPPGTGGFVYGLG